jgi:hypothetical protein
MQEGGRIDRWQYIPILVITLTLSCCHGLRSLDATTNFSPTSQDQATIALVLAAAREIRPHFGARMKYVLVSGGVISGIGKGVIASSSGLLLKTLGLRVTAIKIDPYMNIDAGTMSPLEHGEVFVLDDGGEVDLDLGNYERYLSVTLTRENNITTGKIYSQVIEREVPKSNNQNHRPRVLEADLFVEKRRLPGKDGAGCPTHHKRHSRAH